MFRLISKGIATAALLCSGFYPQISYGETFKSAEFVKWSEENRTFYLTTAIGMAGLIARRNNASQGDCIDHWFFDDQGRADGQILAVMAEYPDHHPQGIILAVLEKQCGKLIYSAPN